uniref:GmrSD restriction endonucleases N-terminal domain-containing protein n=1 Tax=Mycena chlorophos TaxID=658473 RepID=A0ABQ0M4V2_MYCCL|nr:predicted protein [Mycena chlorophos]
MAAHSDDDGLDDDDEGDYVDPSLDYPHSAFGGPASAASAANRAAVAAGSCIRHRFPAHMREGVTTVRLFEWLQSGKIDLEAEYQRDFVWKAPAQESLVDSLLRGAPVNQLMFKKYSEHGLEKLLCVDGKQRLTSLWDFMSGKIPFRNPEDKRSYYYTNNGTHRGVHLLPAYDRRAFDSTIISCLIFDYLAPNEERDIFQRVQQGKPLTNAEKLRAISSPRSQLIQSLEASFLTNESSPLHKDLFKTGTRAAPYRSLAQVVGSIALGSLTSMAQGPEKWLRASDVVPAGLASEARETLRILEAIHASSDALRVLAPAEFVGCGVLVQRFKGTRTLERLVEGVRRVTGAVRAKHPGRVQMNLPVFVTMEEATAAWSLDGTALRPEDGEVCAVERVRGGVDADADAVDEDGLSRKRPRQDDDEDADEDEDEEVSKSVIVLNSPPPAKKAKPSPSQPVPTPSRRSNSRQPQPSSSLPTPAATPSSTVRPQTLTPFEHVTNPPLPTPLSVPSMFAPPADLDVEIEEEQERQLSLIGSEGIVDGSRWMVGREEPPPMIGPSLSAQAPPSTSKDVRPPSQKSPSISIPTPAVFFNELGHIVGSPIPPAVYADIQNRSQTMDRPVLSLPSPSASQSPNQPHPFSAPPSTPPTTDVARFLAYDSAAQHSIFPALSHETRAAVLERLSFEQAAPLFSALDDVDQRWLVQRMPAYMAGLRDAWAAAQKRMPVPVPQPVLVPQPKPSDAAASWAAELLRHPLEMQRAAFRRYTPQQRARLVVQLEYTQMYPLLGALAEPERRELHSLVPESVRAKWLMQKELENHRPETPMSNPMARAVVQSSPNADAGAVHLARFFALPVAAQIGAFQKAPAFQQAVLLSKTEDHARAASFLGVLSASTREALLERVPNAVKRVWQAQLRQRQHR